MKQKNKNRISDIWHYNIYYRCTKNCLKHDNQGEFDVIIDEKMNLQKTTTHNLYQNFSLQYLNQFLETWLLLEVHLDHE